MVGAADVYIKTRTGTEEVKSRKMKLPPKLRTMLILIDGRSPALVVREEAKALGAPPDCIEQLEKLGLVEKIGAAPVPGGDERRNVVRAPTEPDLKKLDPVARFRMAQQFMNDTAVNALGLKAFFFTLKLEKAATVEELRPLVDDYRKAITKGSGEEEAAVLTQRLEEMLA